MTFSFNTLRPRQNGRRFADDTLKRIFLNENVRISIKISLKFVPTGPINNNPALVQIMAWRRSGDKPLSEPMIVSLLTHICVTRPQWVNDVCNFRFTTWFHWKWPTTSREISPYFTCQSSSDMVPRRERARQVLTRWEKLVTLGSCYNNSASHALVRLFWYVRMPKCQDYVTEMGIKGRDM